jgi:hypothetical protein
LTKERYKNVGIIGAGFFGVSVAIHLVETNPNLNVVIIESESQILSRASRKNQARVHRGYHYPRSFKTAYSSNINYERFCSDFYEAISWKKSFYGIAKNSLVNANQFQNVYKRIGAPIRELEGNALSLFNFDYLQKVYEVKESFFNFEVLKLLQGQKIAHLGIDLRLESEVIEVTPEKSKILINVIESGVPKQIEVDFVFNCTYTMLNQFHNSYEDKLEFIHELTEVALIEPPEQVKELGITIMDGPFFSTLPFPSRNCHSLTHVTFTPHSTIEESYLKTVYKKIGPGDFKSKFDWMIAGAKKYVPIMSQSSYLESNFEIKSTLRSSLSSDSRPIFINKVKGANIYNVFGAKLDNVYDVFKYIDQQLESF